MLLLVKSKGALLLTSMGVGLDPKSDILMKIVNGMYWLFSWAAGKRVWGSFKDMYCIWVTREEKGGWIYLSDPKGGNRKCPEQVNSPCALRGMEGTYIPCIPEGTLSLSNHGLVVTTLPPLSFIYCGIVPVMSFLWGWEEILPSITAKVVKKGWVFFCLFLFFCLPYSRSGTYWGR